MFAKDPIVDIYADSDVRQSIYPIWIDLITWHITSLDNKHAQTSTGIRSQDSVIEHIRTNTELTKFVCAFFVCDDCSSNNVQSIV